MRIEVNRNDLDTVRTMLSDIRGGAEKAIISGLRKTLPNVRTRITQSVREVVNMKAARVKKDIIITNPTGKSISAAVTVRSRPPGLIEFGARQTAKGVTYKKWKIGARQLEKGAFIAVMSGATGTVSNKHVMRRKDYRGGVKKPGLRYSGLPREFRMPLKAMYGPRVATILMKPEILRGVEVYGAERASVNILHAADYILMRYRG